MFLNNLERLRNFEGKGNDPSIFDDTNTECIYIFVSSPGCSLISEMI